MLGRFFTNLCLSTTLLVALLLSNLVIGSIPKAIAAPCYPIQSHTICLLDIQRSAKNYWEYRVKISIDGVVQPVEIYNCRDRLRVSKQHSTPFLVHGIGEKVCSLFK
ncbi:MAG: hypothetical protein HC881_07370 [Leptolyngbyaceae cyanobacterium SL_7_1]|nr:hypothetical protein [Leptolyngbyaceae cyanobacterium SL_7_1]